MEVVLDTVSLSHLLREPKHKGSKRKKPASFETALDESLRSKELKLRLDSVGGLLSEWKQTCNAEIVGVLLTKWVDDFQAIRLIEELPKITSATNKRLRDAGFTGTIDRLILRLALPGQHHIIVSDDNDFWDPASTTARGKRNSVVARLCREELGVTITLLKPLLSQLRHG